MRTSRNALLARLSLLAFVLLSVPRAAEAQSVFSHTVPIKLPKAANGMQPELALVYNPSAGNGTVGVGWQLTGLSFVTRVSYGEPIQYAGADTYAHSQLGVLVRQPDGTYRSKKESFVKLVPSGTCGDGPCSWTAYDRSGTRFVYSTTLPRSGTSSVRTWAARQVIDVFGNSYTVSHVISGGHLYPSSIRYTDGPGIADTAVRTVDFEYETTRSDVETSYAQGDLEQIAWRLKWIIVKSQGALLRKYRLDYQYGDATTPSSCSVGTQTGRSRLVSVVELGSDGTSTLPKAQTFQWQAGGCGFVNNGLVPPTDFTASYPIYYIPYPTMIAGYRSHDAGVQIVDLNRDGRLDLIQAFSDNGTPVRRAWLNDGRGQFAESAEFRPPAGAYFAGRSTFYNVHSTWDAGLRVADLDADGRPDLLQGITDGTTPTVNAWRNNGARNPDGSPCSSESCAWEQTPAYAPPVPFVGRNGDKPNGWDGAARIADLNADGKADLMLAWRDEYSVAPGMTVVQDFRRAWINTGTGWREEPGYVPPAFFVNEWMDGGLRLADINGDGRPDLLQGYGGWPMAGIQPWFDAWINTGAGWQRSPSYAPPAEFVSATRQDVGTRIVDLNADGRADIVRGYSNTGAQSFGAWLNNGNGWVSAPAFTPPSPFVIRDGDGYIWDGGVRFAELNGDGKPDLVKAIYEWNGSYHGAWVNTARGWVQNAAYAPPAGIEFTYHDPGWRSGLDTGLRLADFDGDGRDELMRGWNENGIPRRAEWNSPQPDEFPDLLKKVNNEIGGTVEVAYAPASRVTGAIEPNATGPGIPNTRPQQLVTSTTSRDGRGGAYTVQYQYANARWFPGRIPDQRNLGFASITTVDAQSGQYSRISYKQDLGFEGSVAERGDFTATARRVKRVVNTFYPLASPSEGTELALVKDETLYRYEADALGSTQTTTTEYDAYGNQTRKTQVADGLPTVVVTTNYAAPDLTNWILSRIETVTTMSGGRTYGQMRNTWLNHVITEKKEWLDTTNAWLVTTMTYDANGNLRTVTSPPAGDGLTRTTTTEYDATFHAYPWRVTNAAGHVTERTYNADGLVATEKDPNGVRTTIGYDAFGRKRTESRTDAGGGLVAYSELDYLQYGDPYQQHNTVATRVDASGRTLWRHEYFDGLGFTYDVTSSGDCPQWVVVRREKDSVGRPSRVSQPFCYGSTPAFTSTTYDEAGRVSIVTTPDGEKTKHRYMLTYFEIEDPTGKITRKYFDARNNVTRIEDGLLPGTDYAFDPLGRLERVTLSTGQQTSTAYDSLNRRRWITDPLGTATYEYDAVGNLESTTSGGAIVSFDYDALNRVRWKQVSKDPLAPERIVEPYRIDYVYDELDVTNGIGRLTSVTSGGSTIRLGYWPSGKPNVERRTIDESTFTHSTSWDLAGRITSLTYPDGSLAEYEYSAGGNLSTLRLDGVTMATWASYDANGRPRTVTFGNGVGTTYGYDVMGHVQTLSTVKGATTLQALTYDWYGRPETQLTHGLNIAGITDGRTNKTCEDLSTDETQTYTYDANYRLRGASGAWGAMTWFYDDAGNATTFSGLTSRLYDDAGNPIPYAPIITRTLDYNLQNQVTGGTGLSDVRYDLAGSTTHRVLDGAIWDYVWTGENRLASVTKDNALRSQFVYGADGERMKKVYTPSTGPAVTTFYAGRTYEKRTFTDGTPDKHTLHLFANGQMIASVTRAGNVATAFNGANGWRTELALGAMYDGTSAAGIGPKVAHLARALAAHPDTNRRLAQGALAVAFAGVLALVVASVRGRPRRRRFSLRMRMASAAVLLVFGTSACTSGRVDPSASADRVVNGNTLGGPPTGTRYYHRNHVNSGTVITDEFGAERTRMVYVPYGQMVPQNSCGIATVTFKFTGKEMEDEISGLYDFGARHYDPALGRFLSADSLIPSVTDSQMFNRYAYARDNPILYVDPTGHMPSVFSDFAHAVSTVFYDIGSAAAHVGRTAWNALSEVGGFVGKTLDTAGQILKAMATDPVTWATFVVAVALTVSGLYPPALVMWVQATAASVAAQSVAIAAGVRDPTALTIIATVAAVAAASPKFSSFVKAFGTLAVAQGLALAEGDKLARQLAPLNALAAMLIVNGIASAFETPQAQAPEDPEAIPPSAEGLGAEGGGNSAIVLASDGSDGGGIVRNIRECIDLGCPPSTACPSGPRGPLVNTCRVDSCVPQRCMSCPTILWRGTCHYGCIQGQAIIMLPSHPSWMPQPQICWGANPGTLPPPHSPWMVGL
ncbi:MAG TPA: FG-GAP-like repeat-containing protein [Anaeromyxobacter sp.]|nr:FG-GAP-like repeat-containing protein [Anaeromyxobacter sp.]